MKNNNFLQGTDEKIDYEEGITTSNMKKEEEFFHRLSNILEEQFPKGEKCQCGRKLPCRSKALVLSAYANIFYNEKIKDDK